MDITNTRADLSLIEEPVLLNPFDYKSLPVPESIFSNDVKVKKPKTKKSKTIPLKEDNIVALADEITKEADISKIESIVLGAINEKIETKTVKDDEIEEEL